MSDAKPLPEQSLLRQLLHYDPLTGEFTWRERPADMFGSVQAQSAWNAHYSGKPAGSAISKSRRNGYWRLNIFGQHFLAHRIAWKLYYGYDPAGQIDHVNGVGIDNRIANLRITDNRGNQRNAARHTNSSGITGVYYMPAKNAYKAEIGVDGRLVYLGLHRTLEAAAAARKAAERVLGFHPNHGRLNPNPPPRAGAVTR